MPINYATNGRTNGQPSKRRAMRFTDQHGRKWSGSIEIRTGYPIRVNPMFRAPLEVPPKYLTYDKQEPNLITINYEAWVEDLENAKRRYEGILRDGAVKFYGEKAPEAIADPPAVLLHEVGSRPDPVEPVLAALSGNKWVLGLSANKPDWASTFFPEPDTSPENLKSEMDPNDRVDQLRGLFPDAEEDEEIELPSFGVSRSTE